MRELSVVGPTPTPSSVCTHCLSGSCNQHRGHKEVGTLLNSPGQGLLGSTVTGNSGEGLQVHTVNACKERQVTVTHACQLTAACINFSFNVNSKKFFKRREVGIARN